jgi:hypothetical protein
VIWLPHCRHQLLAAPRAACWGSVCGWPDVHSLYTAHGANSLGFYAGTWGELFPGRRGPGLDLL